MAQPKLLVNPPTVELRQRVEDLETHLSRLRHLVDRLDGELDETLLAFESLLGPIPEATDTLDPGGLGTSSKSTKISRSVHKILKDLARPGTSRFRIDWPSKRAAVVEVGDSGPFSLTPKLARLLDILASGKVESSEVFVPWKSLSDIGLELQIRAADAHPAKRHAVTELLRRLRLALLENHVNPFLVETHKTRGARLRYRPGDL